MYEVAESILKDAQTLFTSNYIHIGADEVLTKCWEEKQSINDWMKEKEMESYEELIHYIIKKRFFIFIKVLHY